MKPKRFRTVQDVHEFLNAIPRFSESGSKAAKLGLERMLKFMEGCGSPHLEVPVIHVAGTNGKGTTCQMLASVFQHAGYRTGLYTSPHLLSYNERVRVNAEVIPDSDLVGFFSKFSDDLEELGLTYFEISTALAFWYFAETSCEIAVIETGLGGRLDATNIVVPEVSVITSVSLDHTDLLGETLADVAREKAGIIKTGRDVVTGRLPEEARGVVRQRARELGATLHEAGERNPAWKHEMIELRQKEGGRLQIDGTGRKKIDAFNAAIAYEVSVLMGKMFPEVPDHFREGIEQMDRFFPGHAHFQKLHPQRRWYFDGAHNPEAVATLLEQVESLADDGTNPVFVLSIMRDKAIPELLKNFQPYEYVYYIESKRERHASCGHIQSQLPQTQCMDSDHPQIDRILEGLKTELVIFAGSFYFYEQVKRWMESQPPSDRSR